MADPGFPGGGAPTPQRGVPTYDFVKISQELHEIERIWTPRGWGRGWMVGASLASPLDPPVIVQCYKFIGYFCMLQKCFLKDTNVKAKLEVSDLFEKIQFPSGWLRWRPYISMFLLQGYGRRNGRWGYWCWNGRGKDCMNRGTAVFYSLKFPRTIRKWPHWWSRLFIKIFVFYFCFALPFGLNKPFLKRRLIVFVVCVFSIVLYSNCTAILSVTKSRLNIQKKTCTWSGIFEKS